MVSKRFEDIDDTCLLEIRGVTQDGRVAMQSMCPPGDWRKEGRREKLVFSLRGEPAHVDAVYLHQRVTYGAIGQILAKHLGVNGFGHETRLAWAGFLLRAGVKVDALVEMGEAMSTFYCNNIQVADVRTVVESTAAALALPPGTKKVKGAPALAKLLGEHGKAVVDRIREWLGLQAADEVVMRGGELASIVNRCEAALLDAGARIFNRGGALYRPVHLDGTETGAIRREVGSVVLARVREAWLTETLSRLLRWMKPTRNGIVPADPAPLYARTLLDRGEWPLPVLRAIVHAPTLDRDGRIIEKPGFDAPSGLLLDFPPELFRPIPQSPTQDDARRALDRLERPLRGFEFVDGAAKSVALAAYLTALIRPSMRTAPMHACDAPTAGTGKSLLVEGVGLLANGVPPAAMHQGKTEDEDEKRLAVSLFEGDSMIHIDNCERPITGDFLCSMLSQEVVQARILGQSERRILPTTTLVLASGNNLQFAGDVSRRVVISRLDAKIERPDTREFDFDFHKEVLRDRVDLVVAALTVLRAYYVAGSPARVTPFGSFPDYAVVRGALVWLDRADPADTRQTLVEADSRRDDLVRVMELWRSAVGDRSVTVAELLNVAGIEGVHLRNALTEIACRGGAWNAKSIGWFLRRSKDRVVEKMAFHADNGRVTQWQLLTIKDQQPLPLARTGEVKE
ncbi:MAG: hypothetical protein ABL986_04705 [Vicinamibacterales bacterium]